MEPKTRYAKSGDVHIAYQVVGNSDRDLILVPGFISHIEHFWEDPGVTRFLRRLASFSRLIFFDKRGTGLSDRVPDSELPTLEQRMDDVRAVMDAVDSKQASLFAPSDAGAMATLFAATYPDRTTALILYGCFAASAKDPDYPWGMTSDELAEQDRRIVERWQRSWGEGALYLELFAPSMVGDARYEEWFARLERLSVSPGAAISLARMNRQIDVRHVLPAIRVPTLVLHRKDDRVVSVKEGRFLAERIPGAKYVELEGADHWPWNGDADAIVEEVLEFLTGTRELPAPDRILTTVMFTDIVDSTKLAADMGDRRWTELLEDHQQLVRRELSRFRGREIDTAGDGFLATFDGPARAIRCASAIRDAVKALGIEIRAGLHTGECEVVGEKVRGVAVHIGARVAALAGPGEVLLSRTVRDLVAGSGLAFEDRGTHVLKGVPGEWQLFAVEGRGTPPRDWRADRTPQLADPD
jgi:class 3 adenylate cyclase/pimeloyl-ACP methyl ester carboxylesterase